MNLTPTQRQSLGWLAIALVLVTLIWLLAPVMAPFVVAAVLAYVLHPAVERLVHRRVPRVLAVVGVVVLALLVLAALLLLVVPILSKELPLLRQQVPLLVERMGTQLQPVLAAWGVQVRLDVASLKALVLKALDGNLEEWLATVLSSVRLGGSLLLALLGNLFLVPVVLFFLLMDWPRLVARWLGLIPPRHRQAVDSFLAEADEVLGQYLRGQLMVMLALSAFYTSGLALAGFDLALPVGVFTGLAVFIPYVGFGLGLLLALMAGLLQFGGWYGLLSVAVVYGLGQLLESFVLTPRLVGERVGLSPLAVIFALMAFGHLLGFVGVLVALPVSAVALVAWRRLTCMYLSSRLYQG
ncbi:AI-2E family transporter [Ideonella livida]|uniref:AI-2E family transporter n=1 Tax=Ideonella livida TaxID=2707176 RepID=A0A7C9PHA1_9BURK|nr:AI-2E family transporter [Ideonella livida]NDY91708.1 AI-2E family transporter [Ideonella livida]